MGLELSAGSGPVLIAFACYLLGVALLGVFSHRYLERGNFVKEYFLGNRGLGGWVLALTVAATAVSGGTFMGFPSLIYTNGWIMALWIASYMVVPLTSMVLLGKRINQVARLTGSVTVPDVLRDRFDSPTLGIVATLLILLFLPFNLVAQFKAGGLVLKEALRLRPVEARFLSAEVGTDDRLHLSFQLPNGDVEVLPIAVPAPAARYLPEQTRDFFEERRLVVAFEVGEKVVEKPVSYPPQRIHLPGFQRSLDLGYLLGLVIFAATVVAYTTYGGFWAVTWTDVLEGLVMLAGVVVLAILAVGMVPPVDGLTGLAAATEHLRRQDPQLVQGPGPKNFLPFGLALSFFLMWSLMGAGQPSVMVRLMSFRDSVSLRRALVLVCGYYLLTYLSLLIIFICARAIYPTQYLGEIGSEGEPDSIMPVMARTAAPPALAGFLLAAPYAAIMSTVAAFLLLISSSLVRDLYQRTINPDVSPATLRLVSYFTTGMVGLVVLIGALNPPDYLQYLIVFTGSGQGCSFLVPMLLALYWRRTTRQGTLAGMLGGFFAVFGLYVLGWIDNACRSPGGAIGWVRWLGERLAWFPGWGEPRPGGRFAPLYPGGLDPLVWGLAAALILGVGVSLLTRPDERLVRRYFPRSGNAPNSAV